MNKNKIIFAVIGIIILIVIIVLVFALKNATPKTAKTNLPPFRLWIYQDSDKKFSDFLGDFKTAYPQYKDTTFDVKTFATYEQYFYTLSAALLRGEWPDMFVLNNNDAPVFSSHIMKISPSDIDPDAFLKDYEDIFGAELIAQVDGETPDAPKIDYVVGIPMGYETLAVFYNTGLHRKTFDDTRPAKVTKWEDLDDILNSLKLAKRNGESPAIPIALWDGSTTRYSPDIFAQFLMLEQARNITDTNARLGKDSMGKYQLAYQEDLKPENQYRDDNALKKLKLQRSNNVKAFSSAASVLMISYPRVIEELIENKMNRPGSVEVSPFPASNSNSLGFVNYDYFVINQNVQDIHYDTARDLLLYMRTADGEKAYITQFPYYFPAQKDVKDELRKNPLYPTFPKITYEALSGNMELKSFPKWLRVYYDAQMQDILDRYGDDLSFQEMVQENKCITETMLGNEKQTSCRTY